MRIIDLCDQQSLPLNKQTEILSQKKTKLEVKNGKAVKASTRRRVLYIYSGSQVCVAALQTVSRITMIVN